MRGVDYIAFCECCGLPNKITKDIMIMYFGSPIVDGFYCKHCGEKNIIPAYLKNIVPDLLK